jgi:hypothetical protein
MDWYQAPLPQQHQQWGGGGHAQLNTFPQPPLPIQGDSGHIDSYKKDHGIPPQTPQMSSASLAYQPNMFLNMYAQSPGYSQNGFWNPGPPLPAVMSQYHQKPAGMFASKAGIVFKVKWLLPSCLYWHVRRSSILYHVGLFQPCVS